MDVVRGSQHLLDERGGGLLAVTCSTCCFLSKDVLLRRATREKLLITTETPNKRTVQSKHISEFGTEDIYEHTRRLFVVESVTCIALLTGQPARSLTK